jgi:hypothetical protein
MEDYKRTTEKELNEEEKENEWNKIITWWLFGIDERYS